MFSIAHLLYSWNALFRYWIGKIALELKVGAIALRNLHLRYTVNCRLWVPSFKPLLLQAHLSANERVILVISPPGYKPSPHSRFLYPLTNILIRPCISNSNKKWQVLQVQQVERSQVEWLSYHLFLTRVFNFIFVSLLPNDFFHAAYNPLRI